MAKEGFEEGAEFKPDFDFHDMSVLYVFLAVGPVGVRIEEFRMERGTVFRVVCE